MRSVGPQDMVVTPMGLRFAGRRLPCVIGRGGLSPRKREGDGATPVGVHDLVGLLYRPDRVGRGQVPDWAVPIRPRDGWSDDIRDPDYNLMVTRPHPFGHEALFRADPLYDLILLTDWNWPSAVKGRGSAIFIHTWRRRGCPTEGCVALARRDLMWMLPRIRYGTRLVVRA